MLNGDFLKLKPPSSGEDIIDDLIKRDRVGLIASEPGQGKTLITLGISYSIAYGVKFLGRKTKQGPVLIVDSENPRDVLIDRIIKIKRGLEDEGYTSHSKIDVQHFVPFWLDDRGTWSDIEQVIKTVRPCLIVLDHLKAFHTKNENCSKAMNKIADAILELKNMADSSIFVVHHFNKSKGDFIKRLRGSTAILAKSDAAYEVRALSHNAQGGLERIGLIPVPRRDKLIRPLRIRIEESSEWLKFKYDGIYEAMEDPVLDLISHMITHVFIKDREPLTVEKAKKIMAGSASDKELREALRKLEQRDIIDLRRLKGKGHAFEYIPKATVCPWCGISSP